MLISLSITNKREKISSSLLGSSIPIHLTYVSFSRLVSPTISSPKLMSSGLDLTGSGLNSDCNLLLPLVLAGKELKQTRTLEDTAAQVPGTVL